MKYRRGFGWSDSGLHILLQRTLWPGGIRGVNPTAQWPLSVWCTEGRQNHSCTWIGAQGSVLGSLLCSYLPTAAKWGKETNQVNKIRIIVLKIRVINSCQYYSANILDFWHFLGCLRSHHYSNTFVFQACITFVLSEQMLMQIKLNSDIRTNNAINGLKELKRRRG